MPKQAVTALAAPHSTLHINTMSRKQFLALPYRNWGEAGNLICASLVIIPHISKHDSGFRNMSFCAVNRLGSPLCLLGGGSDVVHIDGIGGYGQDWLKVHGSIPRLKAPSGWTFDCLPISGLLHMWVRGKDEQGRAVRAIALDTCSCSSFEIYATHLEST